MQHSANGLVCKISQESCVFYTVVPSVKFIQLKSAFAPARGGGGLRCGAPVLDYRLQYCHSNQQRNASAFAPARGGAGGRSQVDSPDTSLYQYVAPDPASVASLLFGGSAAIRRPAHKHADFLDSPAYGEKAQGLSLQLKRKCSNSKPTRYRCYRKQVRVL